MRFSDHCRLLRFCCTGRTAGEVLKLLVSIIGGSRYFGTSRKLTAYRTSEIVLQSGEIGFHGLAGSLAADRWAATDSRGTVLLLHGGGQTRHSWRRSGSRFAAANWDTIALDLRGHGDSAWAPDGDYSIDALVGDLRAVVDSLGEPPVLVGASMGGITSLVAVGEGVVDARALVLVDVAPKVEQAGVDRIIQFMAASPAGFASLDEVADAVAVYNPNRPRSANLDGLKKNVRLHADGRWYWHWDPAFLRVEDEPRRDLQYARMEVAARNISVPTMLVRGTNSDVVSDEGVRSFQQLIPHAVVRSAEAGHMVAGDDNDVFVSQVVDFLSESLA